MESMTKALLSFVILIILVFGLYFATDWFSKVTGYALGEDEKVKLAQCLGGKKSVFYISSTCPKCIQQLELLGETASRFIDIFECTDAESCPAKGGVPAWKINGQFHYGFHSLGELQRIAGCEIEN